MSNLTREEILNMSDLTPVPVNVPEWGGQVYVRPLTALEKEVFESYFGKTEEGISIGARLVSMAACDANGEKLFAPEDIVLLSEKSGSAIGTIFAKAQGLTYPSRMEQEERLKK